MNAASDAVRHLERCNPCHDWAMEDKLIRDGLHEYNQECVREYLRQEARRRNHAVRRKP